MRVAHFKVERYRSIQRSESIDLTTMSVLVGPNNEGKSNILRSLVVGLQALEQAAEPTRGARLRPNSARYSAEMFQHYSWQRDFPLRLQASTPGASSVFEFVFSFDADELVAFRKLTGHTLNGELKLRILIGNKGVFEVKAVKKGRGSVGLNDNITKIAKFVSQRIRVQYIPVSRTAEESRSLVRGEVASLLRNLAQEPEFEAALETIDRLTSEAMRPLEDALLESIHEFLPEVKAVAIRRSRDPFNTVIRELDVEIDDGELTSLAAKGDGIQSLTAIAFIKRLAARTPDVSFILAVEEPEAHLHPGAVHKLRDALQEVSGRNQVILTTHTPILVNREDVRANILVHQNVAAPARCLEEVRESLGVRLPDNMHGAEVVLLVEGAHDKRIVEALLRTDRDLSRAVADGRLALRPAGGAASMPYQYRLYRDSVCKVHVLLDDDAEGRSARRRLESDEAVRPSDVSMVCRAEASESEIEDLFDEVIFDQMLLAKFNVARSVNNSRIEKKFSFRMKDHFLASGQGWSSSLESALKASAADVLCDGRDLASLLVSYGCLDAIVRALRFKLGLPFE